MAGILDSLAGFTPAVIPTATQPVVPPTSEDVAQVESIAQSPAASEMVNVGLKRGNETVTQNQILVDKGTLTAAEFLGKYGTDINSDITTIENAARSAPSTDLIQRSAGEMITDNAINVGSGLVQSLGGIGALGAGVINQDAGIAVSEKLNEFSTFTKDLQSKELQLARAEDTIRATLDNADSDAVFERNRADDETFIDALGTYGEKFISDVSSGAGRLLEDPMMLEAGTAEGIGSLLAGGPVSKGIGVASKAAGLVLGKGGAWGVASTMPAAIALMEGGNAYSGAINEVMGMDNAELAENSALYRELIEGGATPEDAKKTAAHRAGLIASAIQAPIAGLSGRLVAGFEANPLGSKTFGDIVKNILNETTEEGIQSLTGELAQNLGIQLTADETRSVIENAGSAMVQGAVFGSMTAGVLQAPIVPGAAVRTGLAALTKRASEVDAINESGSGVTESDLTATADVLAEVMPAMPEAVAKAVETLPAETKAEIGADSFKPRVERAMTITDADIAALGPDILKGMNELEMPVPATRLKMAMQVATLAANESMTPEARLAAGLFLNKELDNQTALFGEDIQEILNPEDQKSKEYEFFAGYNKLLEDIKKMPTIVAAMKMAEDSIIDLPDGAPVTEQTQANILNAATSNPAAITPTAARVFMKQDAEGKVKITPEQRAAMRNVTAMHNAEVGLNQQMVENNVAPAEDPLAGAKEVSQQLFNKKGGADWMLPAKTHIARINEAVINKDNDEAMRALKHFGYLAASQRNKARAALQSYQSGSKEPVKFTALGSYGRINPTPGKITIHKGNANSERLAKQIFLEANALMDMFNKVVDANPELGFTGKYTILDLPSELFTKAEPKKEEPVVEKAPEPVDDEARREAKFDRELEVTEQPSQPATTTVEEVAETVVGPAPEVETTPEVTLETAFPLLRTGTPKGKDIAINRFLKSFSIKKEMGPLLKLTNPIKAFMAQLVNIDTKKVPFTVTEEQLDGLYNYMAAGQDMIYGEKDSLRTRLADFARKPFGNSDDRTYWKLMQEGEDVAGYQEGRAAALVQTDGKYSFYNPALIETAMMAGLHWYASRQNREVKLDDEAIAKIVGVDVSQVTKEMMAEFNDGVGLTQARRTLADTIVQFWGLALNRDTSESYVKGIPEALASEILHVMEDRGWFTVGEIQADNRVFKQFYFDNENTQNGRTLLSKMGVARKVIEIEALAESDRSGSTFGKPPKNRAKTQLRNRVVANTPKQMKAIATAQAIKFNFNQNSYDMQQALGANNLILLGGSMIIEKDTVMNTEHRKSVEGFNRTVSQAVSELRNQYEEALAFLKPGEDIADLNKHYEVNYTRANRLQFLGLVNPQSDKRARNVWMPNRATIDMMNNPEHITGFWDAVAQGMGESTHNATPEANMTWAVENVGVEGGTFFPLVQMLQEWLDGDRVEGSLDAFTQKALEISPSGVNEHAQLALISVAEYLNAVRDNADLSKFTTFNFFEADGITNGAANALMNLSTMSESDWLTWLNTVNKVGAFIGTAGKTMADQAALPGHSDLYNTASTAATRSAAATKASLSPEAAVNHSALFRVINGLGMKISINAEGNVEVARKAIKNPFTITMYRSGPDGIAGNVTNELLGALYEKITEYINSPDSVPFGEIVTANGQPYSPEEFWQDLATLSTTSAEWKYNPMTKENEWRVKGTATQMGQVPQKATLASFKMSDKGFNSLKTNIRHLLVTDMVNGINATVMDHVKGPLDTIQKTTNAQSIVMHHMFRKEILMALADRQINPDKYPDYKQGDFLTANELDAILKKLLPYGASFKTAEQSFFVGTGERNEILSVSTETTTEDGEVVTKTSNSINIKVGGKDYKITNPDRFSRSLSKGNASGAYAFAPSQAGVAGVPLFVIGTGDGRAIDHFLTREIRDKIDQALVVFDGINFGVDNIINGSKQANAAVWQSWIENPLTAIEDSYSSFLRLEPLDQLFDENDPYNFEMDKVALALSRNATGRRNSEVMTLPQLKAEMATWQDELSAQTIRIQARINVMKRMPLSVDQMAGGAAPYSQEGTIEVPAGASNTVIAKIMEQEFNTELAKLEAARKSDVAIEKPSTVITKSYAEKGTVDPDTGVTVVSLAGLGVVAKQISPRLSNTNREMLAATLNSLQGTDFKVVSGTPEQVAHYERNNYPESYNEDDTYLGKIDVENQVIYLTNASGETLVHELLHAATVRKMQAYYAKDKDLLEADREAIERMEGLKNEWLSQSFENMEPAVQGAHDAAVSSIMTHQNAGRKAEALNEFLAWSLSNQKIINLQKKTQVKNPLYSLLGDALGALKRLIWGHKKAPQIGNDMFSQVRFNARVLMSTPTPMEILNRDYASVAMFQSPSFGSNSRLTQLRMAFGRKVGEYTLEKISNDKIVNANEYAKRHDEAREAIYRADRVSSKMSIPFGMDMQQKSTFAMINAAFAVSNNLNVDSLNRLQDIYDAVISKMTVEMFMADPNGASTSVEYQADRTQAQAKFDAVAGVDTAESDAKGRSSLLPSFVALAMVNEPFRAIMRTMILPKRIHPEGWSLDNLVDRFGNMFVDGLSALTSKDIKKVGVTASMDALVENLLTNVGDQRSFIEQRTNGFMDGADNLIKGYVEKSAAKARKFAKTLNGPVGSKVGNALEKAALFATSDGAKLLSNTAIQKLNQEGMNIGARELMTEIIGRTEDNAPVFDEISRARTFIDQTRQQWREAFPKELRKKFSKPLDKEQWKSLFNGLGRTDAAALLAVFKPDQAMEMLSDADVRQAEIARLEGVIKNKTMLAKAKQLAWYMGSGEAGVQLQRNAYAIAALNGSKDPEIIENIDTLVSLYAVENLSDKTKNTLTDLITNEKAAMENLYGFLNGVRALEADKGQSSMSRMNGYKGDIRSVTQDGVNLIIADKSQHGSLVGMGYQLLGPYNGTTADTGLGSMGYYFTEVSGRAKFNQGVMRTVRRTQFGVDPDSGYTVNKPQAGRITNPQQVAVITARINRSGKTSEYLLPIYNENGQVTAYERSADPVMLAKLNPAEDLADALGAWRGRQTEEDAADAVNDKLVNDLLSIWNKGKSDKRNNEFVRVDRSTDPVIQDAWANVPPATKAKIETMFGLDGFMVRKDMVNDAIGARSSTVGDFWTGNSRWKPAVQAEIRSAVMGMFGNKGYGALVNAEAAVQGFVTDAKVLIVIKSMIVPVANILSNVYQLSINGVPMRNILNGLSSKTAELNSYINRRSMEMKLQNDLLVAEGREDQMEMRRISARIRTLQDSYKRMSIHPLLEAGEFGAVTEGGVTQEDMALANGGWAGLIDRLANKLPNGLKDPARYALITRDTSLFKALSRATQYGDFLGKAILYDDLTKRKKMSQQEAIAFINEEFINYNRFAGRARGYQESMGLTWFWHFKLRSMKIGQRMLHNHPFRALMHTAFTPRIPLIGSVGSPLTDGFLSVVSDGRIWNSVGPGQLFRAPQLNPWMSMID